MAKYIQNGKMICLGLMALLAGCNNTMDIEQQVNELYDKMPQEERIAQLRSMYMDDLFDEQGQLDTTKCRELIPLSLPCRNRETPTNCETAWLPFRSG